MASSAVRLPSVSRWCARRGALLLAAAVLIAGAACSPTAPPNTPLPTPAVKGSPIAAGASPSPAASPAAAASPGAAASPVAAPAGGPSPAASPSPAAAASPTVNPVTVGSDVVAAPSGASVRITAPAANATVPAGTLRVAYDVSGAELVPAAEARRVEDLHVHVLLDVDPAPYVGTTIFIPLGQPNIIHTAAREVTLQDVRPGQHRVTVVLTGANHVSVRPPVTDSVTFTVQ